MFTGRQFLFRQALEPVPDLPLPEIVRRLGERRAAEMRASGTSVFCTVSVTGEHNSGPLPGDFVGGE